ncbi:MAG: VOC family protein [Bacteroidetes bacterium]|nr:MAG: VOC family protein [Bacteroidota bacterium]
MAQINAYLKFDGNCREAMTFYKECFGGELIFNTVKGSPLENFMKPEEGDKILHSSLISDKLVLFASEMTKPTTVGDAIFLWINTGGDEETRSIFAKLTRDGKVTADLQMVYWGKEFGAVTDKYGINWYVSSI